jgi:hypothetical protein
MPAAMSWSAASIGSNNGVAARYEKPMVNYRAQVVLASIVPWLAL